MVIHSEDRGGMTVTYFHLHPGLRPTDWGETKPIGGSMLDLERVMLLSGARRASDDGSDDYHEEWIVTDEALKTLICTVINKSIDYQRSINYQYDASNLINFRNGGIKWTQK